MPAIKILIVDDEEDMENLIRLSFRKGIKQKRYEFQYVSSGQAALECLHEAAEIDIILCDINMPEMNGLMLLEQIKALPLLLKTIMVTAYENMQNIRAAMNGGAFDFVTKPINFTDLETTIQKAYEELMLLRAGAEAQEQLPLTQQALDETDKKARYLEELDELKSRFFTNISHEFRTPLTVIRGMAEQIDREPEKWSKKGNRMIRRNADQLLDLVNQILDLRKLEAGQLTLHSKQIEVIAFLRYVIESFHAIAEAKEIDLTFQVQESEIWMDVDEEKLLRILSNLLSNALKFTPAGGQVRLEIQLDSEGEQTNVTILVADTGTGIPSEEIPFIFDRFYQVDPSTTRQQEGTGIGLALTRELVHLMQGSIQVESATGKGSQFQIHLPLNQTAPRSTGEVLPAPPSHLLETPIEAEQSAEISNTETNEQPSLLIIEDNPDVVEYLMGCLADQYQLLVARDGQEGIDMALEMVPDLILSDVMMPRKDGFEVCQLLKTDERTSHIPIVLLTAKADAASRIQGLSRGADAYLAKPFHQEELFVRLSQLLALRQALRTRYQSAGGALPPPDEAYQQEDEFLARLRETVEAKLHKSFDIPDLCQDLGLSRTNLHRKIKALTGNSISVFIRKFRLQKGKGLLASSHLQISEIAYEVGFTDPGYFTKSFAKEFGLSPREYREQSSSSS